MEQETLKTQVREKYHRLAEGAEGAESSCCGAGAGGACMSESYAGIDGYAAEADLSLGCGLPTEHARLQSGETVLDLGSGAGVDAFVARGAVGPEGRVVGVDFAEAMVEKARRNAGELGCDNVASRPGEIEALPVEDDSIDVAVSNCVLNLVPDKRRAFREIFRVLRPGGRFCISDIVSTGPLPEGVREAAELYAGCVAGALPKDEYLRVTEAAGFTDGTVAKERALTLPDEVLRPHLSGEHVAAFRASGAGLLSGTVVGTKPEGA